jgi:hypothetical protein
LISREAQLFVGWVSALRNPCWRWVSCFNSTHVHLIFNSTHLLNIKGRTEKSNLAVATAILAGLVLSKEITINLLREEIMGESVIDQDIQKKGRR